MITPNPHRNASSGVREGMITALLTAGESVKTSGRTKSPATGFCRYPLHQQNQNIDTPKMTNNGIHGRSNIEQFKTAVKALNLSQPDDLSCQATCIGMAIGDSDISKIRKALLRIGQPGSPEVMAAYIRSLKPPVKYEYSGNASIEDMYKWLSNGREFLITHGYFTGSGHVIALDGVRKNANGTIDFDVRDPYAEFEADRWLYDGPERFYTGFYSERLIYATCVAGKSRSDARSIYSRGELNRKMKNAWVHRFKP